MRRRVRSSVSAGSSGTTTPAAPVTMIEYVGHPSAQSVLEQVAADVAARTDVEALAVAHRLGPLQVGEAALVVAVSAAHRQEAFVAAALLVDEVKDRLPVWKRQQFRDGTDEWVACPEGSPRPALSVAPSRGLLAGVVTAAGTPGRASSPRAARRDVRSSPLH